MSVPEPSGNAAATPEGSLAVERELTRQLDRNAQRLREHIGQRPDDFDGREHLYMEYHQLLRLRDAAEADRAGRVAAGA
jgi:hypothetical protein